MPKKFYTEKDIEDLFQGGVKSLQVTEDVVLTELAYEKARRLGLDLISDGADRPPSAPVRPYLVEATSARARPAAAPVSQAMSQPALTPATSQSSAEMLREEKGDTSAIENRIRSAVIAKLGSQVDAKLLDNIIHRVVNGIGLK